MYRAVAAVPLAGLLITGCSSGDTGKTTASATSTTIAATPTPAAPVPESALDGLLLTPAEMDTATGMSGLAVAATSTALATDIQLPPDAAPEKIACVGIAGTAEAQAYAGAGSTAVRDQVLQTAGDNGARRTAVQSVILFDSPQKASAFVTGSAAKWSMCREFGGEGLTSAVGAVATDEAVVTATITTTNTNGDSVDCQRALTAANNVVVESSACSAAAPDAAAAIARAISAKVAKG